MMDKDKPEKVVDKADKPYGWIYLCPNCKSMVCGGFEGERCLECGQLLDWKNKFVTAPVLHRTRRL